MADSGINFALTPWSTPNTPLTHTFNSLSAPTGFGLVAVEGEITAIITSSCASSTNPNPTDPSSLTTLTTQTGFTGIQDVNAGFTSNVNSRFFGGDQVGDARFFQLAAAYRASGLSLAANKDVAVTPEGRLRWSVWLKGNTTWLNSSAPGANFDGTLASVTGGVDVLVTDYLLVGALVGWENFDLDTAFNNGAFKGKGITVGPYLGIRFLDRFVVSVLAAWTWLDQDVSGTTGGTTASASYDATRWMIAANLAGHWHWRKLRLSPEVSVVHAEETRDSFTNSAGQVTAVARTKLGRAAFGPELGVTVYRSGTSYVEPYVFLKGQYDFETQGTVVLASGAVVAAQQKLSARLGFGLNAQIGRRFTARVGGFYDGIGRANFESWTVEGRIRFRW